MKHLIVLMFIVSWDYVYQIKWVNVTSCYPMNAPEYNCEFK